MAVRSPCVIAGKYHLERTYCTPMRCLALLLHVATSQHHSLGPGRGTWSVGIPEDFGMDSELLSRAAAEVGRVGAERYCLLIAKDGVIVEVPVAGLIDHRDDGHHWQAAGGPSRPVSSGCDRGLPARSKFRIPGRRGGRSHSGWHDMMPDLPHLAPECRWRSGTQASADSSCALARGHLRDLESSS